MIAQLVEQSTVVGDIVDIDRSLVQFRVAGNLFAFGVRVSYKVSILVIRVRVPEGAKN